MTLLTPRTNSTLGGESLSSVRKSADLGNKRLKQTTLIRNTEDGKVTMMSIGEMSRVYSAEVEAVLYRHEPLTCLLDPMVIAALTLRHPPMKSFIPQNCDTIYTSYVLPIDIATTSELVKYVGLLPGMVAVSFDGVTANRKSKVRRLLISSYDFVHYSLPTFCQILYTVSKGAISMIFKWSNLGSNVHVTDAEVDDAYRIWNQIKSAFDTKIASISVGNATGKSQIVLPKSCSRW